MILHQIRKLCAHNPQFCIQHFVNGNQSFEIKRVCNKSGQHLHGFLLRRQYHSSQQSIAQRESIVGLKSFRCTRVNVKFKYHTALATTDYGIFRASSARSFPMYQSQRFFGDSAATFTPEIAGSMVGSNAPIGQYDTFAKLLYDNVGTEFFQNSLISLHSYTGLPWWADIILVTIACRTFVTLPLALFQESNRAKIANVKVEMNQIVRRLKAEANLAVDTLGWTEHYTRSVYNRTLNKKWKELIVRDNCHPAKSLILILVQFPMWLCLSASLRNLCFMLPLLTPRAYEIFTQLSTGGFGWISDLTAVDSYWMLPILVGILNLINIEIGLLLRPGEKTKAVKITTNIVRGISLLLVPLASLMPSCMCLYWTISSAYGILQHCIVISPKVRRFVRIPKSDIEYEHPYQHLYNNFKDKYGWIKNIKAARTGV